VDPSGGVHISYLENGSVDLRYAYRPWGAEWTTSTIDGDGFTGYETSIAVDTAGNVHVGYYDGTDDDLRYAHLVAKGAWTTTTLDSDGDTGLDGDLTVDREEGVHIAYRRRGDRDGFMVSELRYAYRPRDGEWVSETVDAMASTGFGPALALDDTGGVHISYNDASGSLDLRYAYRVPGGDWVQETLNTGATRDSAIAIAASGRIHLCYGELAPTRLACLSKLSGEAWMEEVVDESIGYSGPDTSLALDSSDALHVSYYDTFNEGRGGGRLRYATRPAAGTWTITTVDDSSPDTGRQGSLAVDPSGAVHISYQDATNRNLRYAYLPACR
jgi:hypothetical protein